MLALWLRQALIADVGRTVQKISWWWRIWVLLYGVVLTLFTRKGLQIKIFVNLEIKKRLKLTSQYPRSFRQTLLIAFNTTSPLASSEWSIETPKSTPEFIGHNSLELRSKTARKSNFSKTPSFPVFSPSPQRIETRHRDLKLTPD